MLRIAMIVIFALAATAHGAVLPAQTDRPLMFLPDRMTALESKRNHQHPSYTYLISRVDAYKTGDVSQWYGPLFGNLGESLALAYLMTMDAGYRDQAWAFIRARYFDTGSGKLWDYTDRDGFRAECASACLVYDWLYDHLTPEQRSAAQTHFVRWGDYWRAYIGTPPDFEDAQRNQYSYPQDSDENTSLASNLLMLAMALHGDNPDKAAQLFDLSDAVMENCIIPTYMEDYMKGGIWAEGTRYSPSTMLHWIELYLINKEARSIPYPNTYMNDVLRGMIHMTTPGKTGMYMYGDVEGVASNLYPLNGRVYDLFRLLADALEDPTLSRIASNWLAGITPSSAGDYGSRRFLFEKENPVTTTSPATENWPTEFLSDGATGMQLAEFRTGWGDQDTSLTFRASSWANQVDHLAKDTGDFAISKNGIWLTKEITGYSGASLQNNAHNGIYVHNIDGGNPSPTQRPVGEAVTAIDSGSGWAYLTSEMSDVWNMVGYFHEDYVDKVERNILFLHAGYTILYDTIVIREANDCTLTANDTQVDTRDQPCAPRRKELYFHFLNDPSENNDVWSSTVSTEKITFQSLYPATHITKVDESVLWAGKPQHEIPDNQKNHHLVITPETDRNTVHFLSLVQTMASDDAPATADMLSGQGGRGVLINDNVAMFSNSTTGAEISTLTYRANATRHYIGDLPANVLVYVYREGAAIAESPINSGDAGVIHFNSSPGDAGFVIKVDPQIVDDPTINIPNPPSGLLVSEVVDTQARKLNDKITS